MPAVGKALSDLIQSNLSAGFLRVSGIDPMGQKDPSKFIAFCSAIGNGIATGAPSLQVVTVDVGFTLPIPAPGIGMAVGLNIDSADMTKRIYDACYEGIKSVIPNSKHEPWPPGPENTGRFLVSLSEAIAVSVKQHYGECWIIMTTHPSVSLGIGTINAGAVSGALASSVESSIMAAGSQMAGIAWPSICKGIGTGVCDSILQHASGEVSITGGGAIPSVGVGSGSAT